MFYLKTKAVFQVLKEFDLFGEKQTFLIKNRTKYKTRVGVFFSFVVLGVICFFSIFFTVHLFKRKNPNIISVSYIDDNPNPIEFTSDNFEFAISLQKEDYSQYIDESIYTLEASLVSIIENETTKTTNRKDIKLIKCSEYPFKLLPSYFKIRDLKNLYCIAPNQKIEISGRFGKEKWTYIELKFSFCNNEKSRVSCQTKEQIKNQLNSGYFGIFATDYAYNLNNYSSPFYVFGNNIFGSITLEKHIESWLEWKNVNIVTDAGLLFNHENVQTKFAYEFEKITNDNRVGENFLTVKIRLSQTKDILYRNYQKIYDVIAQFSAIIKVLMIAGETLTFSIRKILYKNFVVSFFNDDCDETLSKLRKIQTNKTFERNKLVTQSEVSFSKVNNFLSPNFTDIGKAVTFSRAFQCPNIKIQSPSPARSVQFNFETDSYSKKRRNIINFRMLFCIVRPEVFRKMKILQKKFDMIYYVFDVIQYISLSNYVATLRRIKPRDNFNISYHKFSDSNMPIVIGDKVQK